MSIACRVSRCMDDVGSNALSHPYNRHFVQEWGEVVACKALDYFEIADLKTLPKKEIPNSTAKAQNPFDSKL